jgi:hypothetical protein
MHRIVMIGAAALCALAAACKDTSAPATVAAPHSPVYAAGGGNQLTPTGWNLGTRADSGVARERYRLDYHNGPMWGTPNVYVIYYGTYDQATNDILAAFITNVGGSPYYMINSKYVDGDGNKPSGAVIYGGATLDSYSHGPTLSDADITAIVTRTVETGSMPLDPNGIFLVVASPDIATTSGLDSSYCAFHRNTIYNGTKMRYAFIGGPARSPIRCAPQLLGPNGTLGADAAVSLIAAEIANILTDPDFNGWYDRLGLEMADKCAWNFGTTYKAPNGALANVHLGTRDYLVQQLWLPSKNGGSCALSVSP